jgi:hypothetical protein
MFRLPVGGLSRTRLKRLEVPIMNPVRANKQARLRLVTPCKIAVSGWWGGKKRKKRLLPWQVRRLSNPTGAGPKGVKTIRGRTRNPKFHPLKRTQVPGEEPCFCQPLTNEKPLSEVPAHHPKDAPLFFSSRTACPCQWVSGGGSVHIDPPLPQKAPAVNPSGFRGPRPSKRTWSSRKPRSIRWMGGSWAWLLQRTILPPRIAAKPPEIQLYSKGNR